MKKPINKIAVFTSGGDAPGMNACIRAVVRTAIAYNIKVSGIRHGFDGMIRGEYIPLDSASVSNIIHRGGTILKTARSSEFMTDTGMLKAKENLKRNNIDAVVAIGGDGTFRGAVEFNRKFGFPFIGIPGTIDNDLYGTDYTLGFDTAVNTTLEAIDRIKDTAAAHDRLFFIEVMGRDTGYIALWTGIAGGAEEILLPETKTDISKMIEILRKRKERGKSTIVIVAEGDDAGGALEIAQKVKSEVSGLESRVTILGHLQRGGRPTCFDRILACRFGVAAVEALLNGVSDKMVGLINNKVSFIDLQKAATTKEPLDTDLIRFTKILS